jgi:putative hydroxymethylpyrimidine transport system substrate-binding protein
MRALTLLSSRLCATLTSVTLASRPPNHRQARAGRALAALLVLSVTLGLAACGERQDGTGKPRQQELSVVLDTAPNANHVGLVEAIGDGSFRAAGLEVSTSVAPGPAGTLQEVASGRADFAISHAPQLLIERSGGQDLVAVAAIVQRPLTSLMSTGDTPVDPRKLEGSRIGTGGLDFQEGFLDEILSSAGVDTSKVKVVDVGYGLAKAMTSKRVDATIGAYWNVEGIELRQARKRPRTLPVDRAGVPSYNELVLVAREQTVRNDGPLVRRFVQALQRGSAAARSNPAAAAQALRDAAPGTSAREARATVEATLPLLFPSDSRRPFGWMNPDRWQSLSDWMIRRDLLKPGSEPLAALTNEYLPGEGVPPPE